MGLWRNSDGFLRSPFWVLDFLLPGQQSYVSCLRSLACQASSGRQSCLSCSPVSTAWVWQGQSCVSNSPISTAWKYGGQWLFMKSSLFYWEQEKGQSVILVQFGIHWLPGWYGEQWLLLKPPFIYCRKKPDIRASYHHISSNSENVTAYMLYNFSSLSTDLAKNELKWLLMRYELTLVWHCAGSLFYKIDCRLLLKEIVSYEMSSPGTWHEERSKN